MIPADADSVFSPLEAALFLFDLLEVNRQYSELRYNEVKGVKGTQTMATKKLEL